MKQIELVITNPTGLHARPAKVLVNLAMKFSSDIKIIFGEKIVNAKSIVSVLTLGAVTGSSLTIQANGVDESAALAMIEAGIRDGLGENEPQ
jgi:phosphotransferase system HPr (HPr) family protein